MPSQAQKHVTHNEAIRSLDALVQLAVLDRDLSVPPVSPADGDRYLVAAGGSDGWAGQDSKVAAWQDGAWAFFAPNPGWLAWVVDEERLIGFDGTAWIDAAVHSLNPAPLVGVNAPADATNRLAVRSPATLLDEEGGDHRLKINKAAASDTASLVFQSGYSGRAEFGLAGDDDWRVKVSPDGAAWTEALKVDRATGRVTLPSALPLADDDQIVTRRHVREVLTGNRTYYVRSDGDDGNDGLADTSGGAFLTIAKAISAALALDPSIHGVTIILQDGTWMTGPCMSTAMLGNKTITIAGSGSANVTIAGTAAVSVNGIGVSLTHNRCHYCRHHAGASRGQRRDHKHWLRCRVRRRSIVCSLADQRTRQPNSGQRQLLDHFWRRTALPGVAGRLHQCLLADHHALGHTQLLHGVRRGGSRRTVINQRLHVHRGRRHGQALRRADEWRYFHRWRRSQPLSWRYGRYNRYGKPVCLIPRSEPRDWFWIAGGEAFQVGRRWRAFKAYLCRHGGDTEQPRPNDA
jgi:hypothetical protein